MNHVPVLTKEVIETLAPQPNENFIDATLGFGGHAVLILEKNAPEGRLLGIDQDGEALEAAKKNLEKYAERLDTYWGNFTNLGLVVKDWKVGHIDGILIDLGVSTFQLKQYERGFSFRSEAPLDMRMDPDHQRLTAYQVVNEFSEKELTKIIYELGEERFSRQIAKRIAEKRRSSKIETTLDLVRAIKEAIPINIQNSKIHFATNTFRALRMYVNDELGVIEKLLPQAVQVLSPGGRLAVISFHSLEDRIIKNFMRTSEKLEILTKKPLVATSEEIAVNPNSRSAKLRVARKIDSSF